jgi:hypothetical protein
VLEVSLQEERIMSDSSKDQLTGEANYLGRGLAIGLAIGAGLGVALGIALDNMAFMTIGVGTGMCIGVAIGASLEQRQKK